MGRLPTSAFATALGDDRPGECQCLDQPWGDRRHRWRLLDPCGCPAATAVGVKLGRDPLDTMAKVSRLV